MIGNALTSFFDNLATKTRNPFLGTFAVIWLVRNWALVFAIFNFDESFDLEQKLDYVARKLPGDSFLLEFGINVLWTFAALIATYTLINASRAITNLFEKRLTPWIYRYTDYGSLVPKTEYQSILERIQELQSKLDSEIQERIKAQNEKDRIEEELTLRSQELQQKLNDLELKYAELQSNLDKSVKEQEQLQTEKDRITEELTTKFEHERANYINEIKEKDDKIAAQESGFDSEIEALYNVKVGLENQLKELEKSHQKEVDLLNKKLEEQPVAKDMDANTAVTNEKLEKEEGDSSLKVIERAAELYAKNDEIQKAIELYEFLISNKPEAKPLYIRKIKELRDTASESP